MHKIDGPGATETNTFTQGNPTTGTPATDVTADWLNAIQAEIIAVLVAAGVTPSKPDNGQLLEAIVALISGGGEAVTAAAVSIADAGNYFSGTDVEAALQQLAAKIYDGTFTANQIRRSIVSLTANSNTQAGHNENIIEMTSGSALTYTIKKDAVYNAPIGTASTIVQGGAGEITISPEDGDVTILKPAIFQAKTLGQNAELVIYKVAANTWRLGGMLKAV